MNSEDDDIGKSTKKCCHCNVWHLVVDFHRSKTSRDGLQGRCKYCNKENSRRQRLQDREHLCELQRAWTAKNAESRKPYLAQRYLEHRDEIRQQAKKRYSEEYPVNPSKYLAKCHKRRAEINGSGGTYTEAEWQALCVRYGGICLMCGKKKPLTVDHIIPVSQGGTNDISDLQPLCRSCNARKSDKIIDLRPDQVAFLSGRHVEMGPS